MDSRAVALIDRLTAEAREKPPGYDQANPGWVALTGRDIPLSHRRLHPWTDATPELS